jgi:AcrR family transcriptional regulator
MQDNHIQEKQYHHGNLKEALTLSFLELLETVPMEKLSLRLLANHVGVAPTAVYNHFKNKDELLATVKKHCLIHFADYLDASVENVTDPKKQINLLGKAYFRYSMEFKSYFDFIMTDNVPDECVTEDIVEASMRAEGALRNAATSLLKDHGLPVTQYNEGLGSFACWSLAHGISTLSTKRVNQAACTSGRWPPEFMLIEPHAIDACFDAMTEVLVAGILSAAKKSSGE